MSSPTQGASGLPSVSADAEPTRPSPEPPYPEAPLASRKAPLSKRDVGRTELQAMAAKAPDSTRPGGPESDGAALAPEHPHVSRSESRADPKPPPRYIDPEVFAVFHSRGRDCLTCGYYRVSAHHLVKRSQGGDDVLANLIPLCGVCHGVLHDGGTARMYGTTVTQSQVQNRIGQFLTSEAGEDHLRYVKAKLGVGAGVFLERYGVEL